MNEIRIVFEQDINDKNTINIKLEDVPDEDLLFKFMISNKGVWTSLCDFQEERQIGWNVVEDGLYTIMMQAKHKGSKKPFSYISKSEYSFKYAPNSMNRSDENIIDFNSVAPIFTTPTNPAMMNSPYGINESNIKLNDNMQKYDDVNINNITPNFQLFNDFSENIVDYDDDNLVPNISSINNNVLPDIEVKNVNSSSTLPYIETKSFSLNNNSTDNFNDKGQYDYDYIKDTISSDLNTYDNSEEDESNIHSNSFNNDLSTYDYDDFKEDMNMENDKENKDSIKKNTYDENGDDDFTILPKKNDYLVGDRITVSAGEEDDSKVYRFFLMNGSNMTMLRDYSSDNKLYHMIETEGVFTIKVQIKDLDSSNIFDEERERELIVKDIPKIDITSFKCLNKERIVNESIIFDVKTNASPERIVLYKFVKVNEDGNQVTIRDFSRQNTISITENKSGIFKLLCMVKDVKVPNKFDDRAVIKYEVMPYKKISIQSFTSDLKVPQHVGTTITLNSEAIGGILLKYRFLIEGPEKIDSGFINANYFKWLPEEEGNYKLTLFVKDESFGGEYEDKQTFNYFVDPAPERNIVINSIEVENIKTALVGVPNKIEINAEGSPNLRYKFIVRKEDEILEMIDYNQNNWVNFMPDEKGSYTIEIHAKDKYSKKPFDAMDTVEVKVYEYIPSRIDYLINFNEDNNLVNRTVKINVITEDGKDTYVKYKILVDGHFLDESQYALVNTISFIPKITGEYKVVVFAKNTRSKEEYDSKKIATFRVENALPVKNASIECSNATASVGEKINFTVKSEDNYDTLYQFYILEESNWRIVQDFSTNNSFSYIPVEKGNCKLLAICKNSLRIVSYDCIATCDYKVV